MEEKQWFLYVADRQEGPFSAEEVRQKVESGTARPSSFVWRQGMSDWELYSESKDFAPSAFKNDVAAGPPVFVKPAQEKGKDMFKSKKNSDAAALGMTGAPAGKSYVWYKSTKFSVLLLLLILGGAFALFATGKLDDTLKPMGLSSKSISLPTMPSFGALDSILAPVKSFAEPVLSKVEPYLPEALKGIFGVKLPEGLSPAAAAQLKEIAQRGLDRGVSAGVATVDGDEATPSLVIASNAPDGTKIDVIVVGKTGTLLNAFAVKASGTAVIQKKVARSTPISDEGRPLPKGEYTVTITAEGGSVGVNTLFLGGKKDDAYAERLNEFNARVAQMVQNSVTELKQISTTLSSMADESATKFSATMKIKAPGLRKKQWDKYRETYGKMSMQIKDLLAKAAANPVPVGNIPQLYQETQGVFNLTEQLHATESQIVEGQQSIDAVRPLAGQTSQALMALKQKVSDVH